GPGVYTQRGTMKPIVDIEGSGELTTKITFTGSGVDTTGTAGGASTAEWRFLTVERPGGHTYATAICNNSAGPRLLHRTANSSAVTVRVGASELSGGNVLNSSTLTCYADYDENYTAPGLNVCP